MDGSRASRGAENSFYIAPYPRAGWTTPAFTFHIILDSFDLIVEQ